MKWISLGTDVAVDINLKPESTNIAAMEMRKHMQFPFLWTQHSLPLLDHRLIWTLSLIIDEINNNSLKQWFVWSKFIGNLRKWFDVLEAMETIHASKVGEGGWGISICTSWVTADSNIHVWHLLYM